MITAEGIGLVQKVLLNLVGPKMWGLHPEKGWRRPMVIEYNGEWYVMPKEDNEYFQDKYFDYTKDVEAGVYVPTRIKVGEE